MEFLYIFVWLLGLLTSSPAFRHGETQPNHSRSAGLHLTGCCYFGSSLMLADLSVFYLGLPTGD